MNIFSRFYCRVYQTIFRVYLPLLPYREPALLENYDELINELIKHKKSSVLLVTGRIVRGSGLTAELEEKLAENNIKVTVFDRTISNPTTENVEDALELFKDNNCDSIIAFGGGSPIDCAKGVAARQACSNKHLIEMKGLLKINRKTPLLIAIPTTAGTGSEATLTAVITDNETHNKFVINDFDIIPSFALLDAKLTLSLPKGLTATTGMDALTHAIEAYIGRSTTKFTRKNALQAIKLIFDNLVEAYNDGANLNARENMLKASYMAGLAFTRSYVGYVHAISHSLGGAYGVPHAQTNATLLPEVLRFYGKSAHKKLWKIGVFVNLFDESVSKEEGARIVIKKIEEMNKSMKIPSKIECIKDEDIPALAKTASREANPLYPVPKLFSAKQLREIYYKIKK